MKTTKAERRRNFNPRKWASKWLKECPLPAFSSLSGNVDRPGVTCTMCKVERFADSYDFPDPVTFVCDPCKGV